MAVIPRNVDERGLFFFTVRGKLATTQRLIHLAARKRRLKGVPSARYQRMM
jgi:hypothetical protein